MPQVKNREIETWNEGNKEYDSIDLAQYSKQGKTIMIMMQNRKPS